MRKLTLAGAVGIVLSLGAFVAAQDIPPIPQVLVRGDAVLRDKPGQTDFTGNARIIVDGVMVEADRIVIQGTVVRFEGNVRLRLPGGTPVTDIKDLRERVEIRRRND